MEYYAAVRDNELNVHTETRVDFINIVLTQIRYTKISSIISFM